MYDLEKNVPLPSRAGRKKKQLSDFKLPLLKMEVKDSFFIPVEPSAEAIIRYKNICRRFCITCALEISEKRSYYVAEGTDTRDETIKGIRIWRKK